MENVAELYINIKCKDECDGWHHSDIYTIVYPVCPKCSGKRDLDAKFCTTCGTKLTPCFWEKPFYEDSVRNIVLKSAFFKEMQAKIVEKGGVITTRLKIKYDDIHRGFSIYIGGGDGLCPKCGAHCKSPSNFCKECGAEARTRAEEAKFPKLKDFLGVLTEGFYAAHPEIKPILINAD